MSNPKQPAPKSKGQKEMPKKGALSDADLKKVSGGNMPTAVERNHSSGGGGGAG